jgi:hypothetical protein
LIDLTKVLQKGDLRKPNDVAAVASA